MNESSPSLTLAPEKLFDSIDNQNVRPNLHDQYFNVAQKAKEEMMKLYLSSAEEQMHRYQQQFTAKMKPFQDEPASQTTRPKLTSAMVRLIKQRQKNVSESVKCVYKYKSDLMHLDDSMHP